MGHNRLMNGRHLQMHGPEVDRIRFGDAVIEYEVRRSARRHKTLEITAGPGGVRVAVPAATHPEDIAAFVRSKARWILDRLAAPAPAPRTGGPLPDVLPYLGRSLRLSACSADVQVVDVRFRPWALQVLLPEGTDRSESESRTRNAVAEWYWLRALEHVSAGVDRWWPQMGSGAAPEAQIGDQRRRWGSCAADGQLRFNWRVVMLAPPLLDYIVVHELAHLTERNHGPRFWALVDSVLPDAAERKRALRAVEGTLPL